MGHLRLSLDTGAPGLLAMLPYLSIVLGTLNRLAMLKDCIPAIRQAAGRLPFEIIVVDGGSSDGTAEYLIEQDNLTPIWQGGRRGAVAAFNAGFEAARGKYVANLNDDAVCCGPVLVDACALLDIQPGAGQVALPFSDPRHPPAVHYVNVGTPERKYLYANFGVTRNELGARLGWWGTHFHHYGGDTELSLRIWQAGYSVIPLSATQDRYIRHYRSQDDTRMDNTNAGRELGRRWRTWNGKPEEGKPHAA